MIEFIEKEKHKHDFKLEVGDIVVTNNVKYLVTCDGFGQFYLISLNGFFIVATGATTPYKIPCGKKFSIGDNLIEPDHNSAIRKVITKEDYKMTVEM